MLVLVLDPTEAQIALDAINVFATEAEGDGRDVDARIADGVGDRLRALERIDRRETLEWVRHAGVGPYRAKPQG
jgi:hypothetical protein